LALPALRAIPESHRGPDGRGSKKRFALGGLRADFLLAGFVSMTRTNRQLAVTLSVLAAASAVAVPAGAQFVGGRPAFDERARPELVQFNDFFQPFWGERNYRNRGYDPYNPFTQQRPQQSYEPVKPPPPAARKPDAPAPTDTVLVIGDQLADWLGYGLEEALADTPQIGIARRIKPYAGLVRYEQRADSPDWSQAVKEMLATEKPSAIVVMLGTNDRLPLRERITPHPAPAAAEGAAAPEHDQAAAGGTDAAHKPAPPPPPPQPVLGPSYEFHTEKWGELYAKRIDEMIAALKTKGVPILWVGLPSIRGAKSTSDMSYLDELYRARADKAGIVYVDIWDGFADDQGRYTQQGPDFEGQTRRLRTYDGVNFTKYGAEKLAHYVEHELRRVLNSHVVPVALPGPEEQAPAKGGTDVAKPAVGPVVPLNAATSEGGELLGSGKAGAAKKEPDALAARVLTRGEALAAPHGRADDFSWPRADIGSEPAHDAGPPPAASPAPSPSSGGKGDKSDAGKPEPNKTEANKADAGRSEPRKPAAAAPPGAAPNLAAPGAPAATPNAAPARPRQTTLDGGPVPRPPLPLGPNAAR
jgi:hypothetical protein